MSRTALRILVRAAVVFTATGALAIGCSRQSEGGRCDFDWAGETQDCSDGLVCTPCGNLAYSVVDRCCRPDHTYGDSSCAPSPAGNGVACSAHSVGNSNGSGGSGTAGSGTAGSGTAGSATSGGGGMSGSAGDTSVAGNAGESSGGTGN